MTASHGERRPTGRHSGRGEPARDPWAARGSVGSAGIRGQRGDPWGACGSVEGAGICGERGECQRCPRRSPCHDLVWTSALPSGMFRVVSVVGGIGRNGDSRVSGLRQVSRVSADSG